MYGHERSLVQRMQGKPFALLGVNSDQNREELKKVLEQQNITWRSFWAGGTNGPIPSQWKVTGWPTIYLIDHKGIVRQKYLGNPGDAVLDSEIEKLVREAEASKASS
jgi:thioredoxin family protein